MPQPEISLIVPLYNEEKVFHLLVQRLDALIQTSPVPFEIVMVNDGSRDKTPELMRQQALKSPHYTAVFLSRNYGHQVAVSAGMSHARGTEAVMIIDGDLQDPPELMLKFYDKIKEGYEVVYAIRKKRKENFIKRSMYWLFYRILKRLSEIEIPLDSGDFSMLSRRVCDILVAMPERSRFLRGMRTWVGFRQIGVEYERDKRVAGDSKYTLKALFKLAYDGIFNFSYVPLKLITSLGLYTILISLVYITYVLIKKLLGYELPSGFTTLIMAITLFSGVQLISLGVIGEYLARIYLQVKNRPLFLVDNVIQNGEVINGQRIL